MNVFRIEIRPRPDAAAPGTDLSVLHGAGIAVSALQESRLFFLEGELDHAAARRAAEECLVDPVTESATVLGSRDPVATPPPGTVALEVHPRPGVMDPVAESTLAELRAEQHPVTRVRTARRYVLAGVEDAAAVGRLLANDCIEQAVIGTAGIRPSPQPPVFEFKLRHVPVRTLDDAALERLSREAHLFLSLPELRAIQAHFRALEREPTDLELETIAQTWSEHCVHKTLKSTVVYRGARLSATNGESAQPAGSTAEETRRYRNLLKETIAKATTDLQAAGRGPECLSVFVDNAGVIRFDDEYGVAFKVETHNHPSAIEPYGGAATGIGGVIRDVIGCGLGAKPVANTDVFCVAPADWPHDGLPAGVLHPARVLRGIVQGVADYGNRMGIPTVNGTVYFDPRYLGNPLVFAGCVGLIPRDKIHKAARPGDLVVLIGGRTGRDGIHGATFSSAELTDTHADEFAHAVQIGNAITEKRFLDAILQARDEPRGCLYTAITDCGAGGLSSAVGEMGEEVGALVNLEQVPLKYAGLRYDEIWISEAQERMVVAVPPANLARFMELMQAEEVEATVIGTFGAREAVGPAGPRVVLRYQGQVVGELDMHFLHHGVPPIERAAEWWPNPAAPRLAGLPADPRAALARLCAELARPNVASKAWIIRKYDHEVQGGSVIKPLVGPGRGPSDAAVLRPRLQSLRGIAVGCGLAPHLADIDPYWMAAAAIDEAVRNVVCVGGDPRETAILDNFCWGRSDDPRQLGALVRASQACYDTAMAYGVPFISGKDSLNNEFALGEADVEPLIALLERRAAGDATDSRWLRAVLPTLAARLRERRRLAIPATLLISALSIVSDVRRCVSPDLKAAGNVVLLVGGLPPIGFALSAAMAVHHAVADLVQHGQVTACHDVSDGGPLVALAEMALAGRRGAVLEPDFADAQHPFGELCAGYLVEVADEARVTTALREALVPWRRWARVSVEPELRWNDVALPLDELLAAWAGRA